MRKNKRIKISGETAMVLMLNAFTLGIFIEKIIINGISWLSTTELFG